MAEGKVSFVVPTHKLSSNDIEQLITSDTYMKGCIVRRKKMPLPATHFVKTIEYYSSSDDKSALWLFMCPIFKTYPLGHQGLPTNISSSS